MEYNASLSALATRKLRVFSKVNRNHSVSCGLQSFPSFTVVIDFLSLVIVVFWLLCLIIAGFPFMEWEGKNCDLVSCVALC